jgi:hypothetical protein
MMGSLPDFFSSIPLVTIQTYRKVLEKPKMMDRSNAMKAIMALLNEDGMILPGGRAHAIVTEYITFKIDRMGPEKALEDVRHTKAHMVAQIHQMAMEARTTLPTSNLR